MATQRRRNIVASRRKRRDEEGEEESSVEAQLDDDSLSEGSVGSHLDDEDADGEASDDSDDDAPGSPHTERTTVQADEAQPVESKQQQPSRKALSPPKQLFASAVSDTEAMLNGFKASDSAGDLTATPFDEMKEEPERHPGRPPSAPPAETRRESFAERKRREHDKYVKERDANPAFVPTKGRFFLHDKRSTEPGTNGHRPFNKPKSRPFGLIVDGNARKNSAKADASQGQWTHDLHDAVVGDNFLPAAVVSRPVGSKGVPTAPRSSPPNRSFSTTTLIGNVPVRVLLPGMSQPVSFPAVAKNQHLRLPQHRPPLRRDKPVRISLPGSAPRYIFPSTERSFIFIPRALRPNQQAYRGRGRGGSFFGGRRPSSYTHTAYSSSVAMSRRSSFGRAPSQEGYPSPAMSVLSRQTVMLAEPGRPVVRLPPPRPSGVMGPPVAAPGVVISAVPPTLPRPAAQLPIYRESRPTPLPMHQPRPQKTVSVADIESPATFPFHPPQPQHEQPFHQQVPLSVNGPMYGPDGSVTGHGVHTGPASVTPLSQIPERAIHAQPFQPYTYPHAPGYYPAAYPPGAMYYPAPGAEYPPTFNPAGGPPAEAGMPAAYPHGGQPGPYMMPTSGPSGGEPPTQAGTVAHEAGGMVYYYDASQMYPNASSFPMHAPGPGGVVGMGGMMTPPGPMYYFPPAPQAGGMYYAGQ